MDRLFRSIMPVIIQRRIQRIVLAVGIKALMIQPIGPGREQTGCR